MKTRSKKAKQENAVRSAAFVAQSANLCALANRQKPQAATAAVAGNMTSRRAFFRMPQEDDKKRAARIRVVAKLIERYFAQLRQELAATRDAFRKRIEHAFASPPHETPSGNAPPGKPPDPK